MLVLGRVAARSGRRRASDPRSDRVGSGPRAVPAHHRAAGRRSAGRGRLRPAADSARTAAGRGAARRISDVARCGAHRPRIGGTRRRARSCRAAGRSRRRHHGAQEAGRRVCGPAIRCSICTIAIGRDSRTRWTLVRQAIQIGDQRPAAPPLIAGDVIDGWPGRRADRSGGGPARTTCDCRRGGRGRCRGRRRRRDGRDERAAAGGVVAVLGIAYACSTDRRAIDARTVAWGLGLQIVFALVVLKTALGQQTSSRCWATGSPGCSASRSSAPAFVFGPLGDSGQWQSDRAGAWGPSGAQSLPFAFQVVPTIIFVAALSAVLYYFGIMQIVVRAVCPADAPRDAVERRRVGQRRGQHLHVPDRGAADDPAVSAGDDAVRADDGDDVRDGAHFGRDDGDLHPVRRRGQASADGGHHDGARDRS